MLNSHPFLAGEGPILMAHRGGGAEVPENSLAALQHTSDLGLRYLETDAHATTDGVVVLLHDQLLDRTTTSTGLLTDRSWEELADVRDASGGALVRLDEALELFPHLRFNVDAKSDSVVGPLAELAARHPERVLVASFSDSRLRHLRALTPESATSLGQGEVARLVALSQLPLAAALPLARNVPAYRHAVAVQVPPQHRRIPVVTRRFVRLAHALGLAVHVWDADDAPTWQRVLAAGADGIITDYPTAARDWLTARGAWH
ncbi:MAG: glycerophosphodiester phosphodiesterase family protein [bacterium]|nr:glycerophosphodiester phosphodiesterase family protein [bacterium]